MTMPMEATPTVAYLPAGSDLGVFDAWVNDPERGITALDTETTGLDVRAEGFSVRQLAFGRSDGSAFVLDASDAAMCRHALALAVAAGRPIWAHNATYDSLAIRHGLGVRVRNLRCSLVLVRTAEPEIIGTSGGSLKVLRPATQVALERLAARWTALSGTPASTAREHDWLPAAVAALPPDDPTLLAYVATDAVEVARLVEGYAGRLTPAARSTVLMETAVEDVWRWASDRGYAVDTSLLRKKLAGVAAAREESLARHGLDLTTTSDAVRAWVAEQGIRITDRDGKPTLSREYWDSAYVPEGASVAWVEFQQFRDVAATFTKLTEIAELLAAAPDGRLHPSIRGVGARTGRMSIKKPALQNLTEDQRGLLLADPGMVLVGCDLDRVEPRVIAALSQDPGLVEAVQVDVYTELAVRVYGEGARGDGGLRRVAKTAFLAMIYGQGADSLAANLGISRDDAVEVSTGIRRAYPVMAAWMQDARGRARSGLPLTTASGRPLPGTAQKPYRAINWIIQGTAADLFKQLTLRVVGALGPDVLYLPVHDELVIQVAEADAESAAAVLGAAMTTELAGVPITGTPALLGRSWGKA